MSRNSNSYFAPSERMTADDIKKQYSKLSENSCIKFFDFFPLPLLVLTSHRQIVLSNQSFLKLLQIDSIAKCIGKRPGEAVGCIYSDKEEAGCGTSEYCRECGAVIAVMESINKDTSTMNDCQLLINGPDGVMAKDLRIFISPWITNEEKYYVVTLMDVEHEKRRNVIERIFFHDILNSASGASSLVNLLLNEVPDDAKEMVKIASRSLFGMVEEIKSQKQLLSMEQNELTTSNITLQGLEIIQTVAQEYLMHPRAIGKRIEIDPESCNIVVNADYAILRRVIINMIINALEATLPGETVTVGLRREGDKAMFWVKNNTAMPESIKIQIFKRSFSTKGKGRGLGTYSIKLLAENYLNGEVGFTSNESYGTLFWVALKEKDA